MFVTQSYGNMTGYALEASLDAQNVNKPNDTENIHRSSSLSSLNFQKNIAFQNTITPRIHKTRSCISNVKASDLQSNKQDDVYSLLEENKYPWHMNSYYRRNCHYSKSKSNIDTELLEKQSNEDEEEVEMILNSTSSETSSPFIGNTEMNDCEEEIFHWKSDQVCHCSACFNKLIENLPKPPLSNTEINKSQSLNNLFIYDPTAPQDDSNEKAQRNLLICTREQNSGHIVTFGLEILNFQGSVYPKDDIAPLWKKDCRMWLWKSVRAGRRRRAIQICKRDREECLRTN